MLLVQRVVVILLMRLHTELTGGHSADADDGGDTFDDGGGDLGDSGSWHDTAGSPQQSFQTQGTSAMQTSEPSQVHPAVKQTLQVNPSELQHYSPVDTL